MLRLTDFIIDCPDTMKLAAFYAEVTGRPIKEGSNENWAGITFGEVELAFIRVDDYRAPQWPGSEHPKQFHLDFEVDEIESEQRRVLDLGATLQQDFIAPTATAGGLHRPHRSPLLSVPQQGRHLDRPGPDLAQA